MKYLVIMMAAMAAFFSPAVFAATEDVAVFSDVANLISVIVPVASLFVSMTPTPASGTLWARVYRVFEYMALVFGKAKEHGKSDPEVIAEIAERAKAAAATSTQAVKIAEAASLLRSQIAPVQRGASVSPSMLGD